MECRGPVAADLRVALTVFGRLKFLDHVPIPPLTPSLAILTILPHPAAHVQWVLDVGMYEPLYFAFDAYPAVVPRVRVRGVMALFLAVSILWALIW